MDHAFPFEIDSSQIYVNRWNSDLYKSLINSFSVYRHMVEIEVLYSFGICTTILGSICSFPSTIQTFSSIWLSFQLYWQWWSLDPRYFLRTFQYISQYLLLYHSSDS